GLSRVKLLEILQERARELGVELRFETEVAAIDDFGSADLVVGADGVNSRVRELYADAFRPEIDFRPNRFIWLGTTHRFGAFTFLFKENEHGLWRAHAYDFDRTHATFIVEATETTWRNAGLDKASEEESIAYCTRLFADDLRGAPLLGNKAIWRSFPIVRC